MSGKSVFGGGQIEFRTLLVHLAGRPLQAEIEESFTPASGEPPQRRHGRVLVSSTGSVRFDVAEGDAPTVATVFDAGRGLFSFGLAEDPATWVSQPWSPPEPEAPVEFAWPAELAGSAPVELETTAVEGISCCVSHSETADGRTSMWYAGDLGMPMRIESTDPTGSTLFRVHSVRLEEPEASWFPST